jgi:hypothetical protein
MKRPNRTTERFVYIEAEQCHYLEQNWQQGRELPCVGTAVAMATCYATWTLMDLPHGIPQSPSIDSIALLLVVGLGYTREYPKVSGLSR